MGTVGARASINDILKAKWSLLQTREGNTRRTSTQQLRHLAGNSRKSI